MIESFLSSAKVWEDPYDSTVYCMQWDGNNALLSGTSRHGVIHLWDMRTTTKCVQTFYVGKKKSGGNSPVYSLAYSQSLTYAALEDGVYALDFTNQTSNTSPPDFLG